MSELGFVKVHPDAKDPYRANPQDAGLDLSSVCEYTLWPGDRCFFDTGLKVAIPECHAGLILPRSGLATKHGVTVSNSPGLIDAGYRGPLMVSLVNLDYDDPYTIKVGDRIAQLLVVPFLTNCQLWEMDDENSLNSAFPTDGRGESGFGGSGK